MSLKKREALRQPYGVELSSIGRRLMLGLEGVQCLAKSLNTLCGSCWTTIYPLRDPLFCNYPTNATTASSRRASAYITGTYMRTTYAGFSYGKIAVQVSRLGRHIYDQLSKLHVNAKSNALIMLQSLDQVGHELSQKRSEIE
jgi:hypothetical protein